MGNNDNKRKVKRVNERVGGKVEKTGEKYRNDRHHGEWGGLKGVDLFFKFSAVKGSSISSFVKFLINNFFKGGGIFIYGQAVGGSVHSSDLGYSSICALLYILQNVWVFDKETMFGEKM